MPIQDHDFPFPQLAFGTNIFMLLEDRILLLDTEYVPQVFVETTPGHSWHVADFSGFAFFTNGVQSYKFDIRDGFGQRESLPHVATCCAYNGQLIVGGFLTPWNDAGVSTVGWSDIGSAIFDLDMKNTSGFADLTGTVLCVKALDNGFMAYTTNSVWRFVAVSEPVVGFGKQHYAEIPGIASRSAVAGHERQHVMVDSFGQLWKIQFGQEPKLLGYEEFFRPMLGHEIIATYRKDEDAYYFTDGNVSYRWDEYGLCRLWQSVTSQWNDNGQAYAYFHDIDNQGFELVSDVLDFGFRGRKTLTSVEIGGSFDKPVFVSADWRAHNEKYFRSLPWKRLNPNGFVRLPVTADEFRIKINSQSKRAEIDYVMVKYQITDRRNLRGSTHVNKAASGADSQ